MELKPFKTQLKQSCLIAEIDHYSINFLAVWTGEKTDVIYGPCSERFSG